MDDYVIGSGALLAAGSHATITPVTLHAQTDPRLVPQVRVAAFDFDSGAVPALSRLVLIAAGWNLRRFAAEIVRPMLDRRENTLADVFTSLATGAGAAEIHLFARWLPDDVLIATLSRCSITVVAHPLDTIRQAALIAGQSYNRWAPPLRAA